MAGVNVRSKIRDELKVHPQKKSERSAILLGVEDEVVTEATSAYVDFTTSFIGGKPVWMTPNHPTREDLACPHCHRSLVHALQIYAPLQNSPFHRCLNLFCCLNGRCWKNSQGWLCIRTQKRLETTPDTTKFTEEVERADDWLSGASDWGDDDDSTDEAMASSMSTLSTEDYANSNVTGATGITYSRPSTSELPQTTAHVEPEEDNSPDAPVTVEDLQLPDQPSDIPGLIFGIDPKTGVELPSASVPANHKLHFVQKFLNVVEEPLKVGGFKEEPKWTTSSSMETDKSDAVYESTAPHHGDKFFWRFTQRLALLPQQIVRYNQTGGDILWMKPPSAQNLAAASACPSCGAAARFEVQVLPSFFNSLDPGFDWTPVDFGNLVVFTCSKSCWEEGRDGFRKEVCLYQAELE